MNSFTQFGFRIGMTALIFAAIAACGSSDEPTDQEPEQAKLYVFGDSLSDTGNLGRPLTFGDDLPAPFFNNRFTNGPVVVDYIAQSLGTDAEPSNYLTAEEDGTNYAVAGAKAESEPPDIDLGRQIDSLVRNNPGPLNEQDLFLIFIGGNDILEIAGTEEAETRVARAVNEIEVAVNRLIELGARRLVIFNLPDIGVTPKLLADPAAAGIAGAATALTVSFNTQLAAIVTSLEVRAAQVQLIDVFGTLNRILESAQALGYENTTQACYNSSDLVFFPYCDEQKLDTFVFFDDIHPSARTHRLIAEEVIGQLP